MLKAKSITNFCYRLHPTGKSQTDADIGVIADIINGGPISRLRRAPKIIRMCTKEKTKSKKEQQRYENQRGIGGNITATIISEGREITDYVRKFRKEGTLEDCKKDREANRLGRNNGSKNRKASCENICSKFRPKALHRIYW